MVKKRWFWTNFVKNCHFWRWKLIYFAEKRKNHEKWLVKVEKFGVDWYIPYEITANSVWGRSLGLTIPGLYCPSTKKKWEKHFFPLPLLTRNHYRFLFDKSWRKGMSLTSAVLTLRSSTARHSTGSRFRLELKIKIFHAVNFWPVIDSFKI